MSIESLITWNYSSEIDPPNKEVLLGYDIEQECLFLFKRFDELYFHTDSEGFILEYSGSIKKPVIWALGPIIDKSLIVIEKKKRKYQIKNKEIDLVVEAKKEQEVIPPVPNDLFDAFI